MKQGIRFFTKPGTFIGQLQWSRHHWWILVGFLVLALGETFVGGQGDQYRAYAWALQKELGLTENLALGLLLAVKLALMVGGAFLLSSLVWFVGNLFGRKTSKRVLFRRLAIVFTVLLGGYILQHLSAEHPALQLAAFACYLWGSILGYFAIREQFALDTMEALVVGGFALLLVTSAWHYSGHAMDYVVNHHLRPAHAVAKQPQLQPSRAHRPVW